MTGLLCHLLKPGTATRCRSKPWIRSPHCSVRASQTQLLPSQASPDSSQQVRCVALLIEASPAFCPAPASMASLSPPGLWCHPTVLLRGGGGGGGGHKLSNAKNVTANAEHHREPGFGPLSSDKVSWDRVHHLSKPLFICF